MKHTLKKLALLATILALGAVAGSAHGAGTKASADPVMTSLTGGTKFIVLDGSSNKTVPASVVLEYVGTTFVPQTLTINGNALSGNLTTTQLLPSQTGNGGKVLGSNGTVASWVDTVPLSRSINGHNLAVDFDISIGDLAGLQDALDGKLAVNGDGTNLTGVLHGNISAIDEGLVPVSDGAGGLRDSSLMVGLDGRLIISGEMAMRFNPLTGKVEITTADEATLLPLAGVVNGGTGSTDNAVLVADGTGGGKAKGSTVRVASGRIYLPDVAGDTDISIGGVNAGIVSGFNELGIVVNGTRNFWITATYGLQALGNTTVSFGPGINTVYSRIGSPADGVLGVYNGSMGGGIVELPQVTSGGTPSANSARVYGKDVGGTAELFAVNEAGKETRVSGNVSLYPNESHPSGYTVSCANGANDLYTVPTGRKALVSDVIVTNISGGSVAYKPQLKAVGGTYYDLGNSKSESDQGIGHVYGMNSINFSAPIVLNAGETFAVFTNASGMAMWAYIVEFDASSPLSRADLTTFVSGDNTLFTVPTGKTVSFGGTQGSIANQPVLSLNAFVYRNSTGSTVSMGSINMVPSGGSPGVGNQFATTNSVVTGTGFSKYFAGNLSPGDFVSINVNSTAAGQIAWVNYILY